MSSSENFRVNSPTVVHEAFEQEVVIIHLDRGHYYTLNESGARIWRLVELGAPIPAIITTLAAEYSADNSTIAAAVNQVIYKLQQEQLLVPAPTQPSHPGAWASPSNHATDKHIGSFAEPLLTKYTDMQDLLLLDPILDVEDTGLPNAKRS